MPDQAQRAEFRDFFLMLDALHGWLQEYGSMQRIDRHGGTAYRDRWGVTPYMVFTVHPEKARETKMRQRIVEFSAAAAIRKLGLERRPYFLAIPQIHYEVKQASFYKNVPATPASLSREEMLHYLNGLATMESGSELDLALDFVTRHPHFGRYRRALHPERTLGVTIRYDSGSLSQREVHCNGIILIGEDIRMRFPDEAGTWPHSDAFNDPAFVLKGMCYYCQPDALSRVEAILEGLHTERPDAWL